MARTMFIDCKSCGNKFDWTISQEDPVCGRCQMLGGTDARAILKSMSGNKVPGQKEVIHVLELMLDRIEELETKPLKK